MDTRAINRQFAAANIKSPDAINSEYRTLPTPSQWEDASQALATLSEQMLLLESVLDNVPHGICLFDAQQRVVLCNQQFAKIYLLEPEDVQQGATLRSIVERRLAKGTCSAPSVEDYFKNVVVEGSHSWVATLQDGRSIIVQHRYMPDHSMVSIHEDITERKREQFSLQAMIDSVPDFLWTKDKNSRFVIANKALAIQTGHVEAKDMIGLSDFDLHDPVRAQDFYDSEQALIQSGNSTLEREECVIGPLGAKVWLQSTKVLLRNQNNEVFGLVGIARNITDRKMSESLRAGQAEVLEMIAMGVPLGEVLTKLVLIIEMQVPGIMASVLLLDDDGLHLRHGAAPNLPQEYTNVIDGVRIGAKVGSCGTAAFRKEAVIVTDINCDPLWDDYRDIANKFGLRSSWSTPVLSQKGDVLGTFAMYSDHVNSPNETQIRLIDMATRIASIAIERRKTEAQVQFMATHDTLTGLPNRALMSDRLAQAITFARRQNRWVSVLFIDLDNFKNINDSLGHRAGDSLLKAVAARMVNCVRKTDTVARLGGDEFVVILFDQPKSIDVVNNIVQNLRAAIARPVQVDGHTVSVTSSIGLSTFPEDGTEVSALLANADIAMYRAKQLGRDNFQFYTPGLNQNAHKKFEMQGELRNALAQNELLLHYQPQVDLRTGRIFAVEALIRWNHPTLGMIPPAQFIPLAEETGLIVTIGEWVLRTACRQNKAWQEAGLPHMNMCVNVSARQFQDNKWIDRVKAALRDTALEAKYLELEITESMIMQNLDSAVHMMKELQALGVQIAIDDFGTGYSSLSALKKFPVARLKIDKSFMEDIPRNDDDKAVTSAVISLGQRLNMRVIAEGVETEAQIAFLRANNCDEMQGYHFSKPITADAIVALLNEIKLKSEIETSIQDE
ncbi:MAG: EAL domain-containing protein [Hyphomicrobiales bacterium]|nr:EAL domain-containing protein [Hyphomicrobiales bacterium]MDE2114386.1 EAL domain-containing protein [Hyphomicrobiales bacterium]